MNTPACFIFDPRETDAGTFKIFIQKMLSTHIFKEKSAVVLTLLLIFLITGRAWGQSEWKSEIRSVTTVNSGGDLPFWMHTNKFGTIDPGSSGGLFGINAHKSISGEGLFEYGAGIDAIGRASENSELFLHEIYGEVRFGFVRFYAGKKEWRDGIWKSDLSLGSMVWSGNAPTMPKIMLSIPEYVAIPGTKGFASIKGYFGHGWMGDDRFVEGAFLHEKAAYLKLMPDDFPVNGHLGVIHNVQWGGTHPTLGKLPQSFGDFLRVTAAQAGEAESAPGTDVINALGNTVGAYEARLDVDLNEVKIKAYKQFYIESGPSAGFRNPWQGKYGLKLNLSESGPEWVSNILWEHVNIKRQDAKSDETDGADQFFDNSIYRSGWTRKGRMLGFPLVTIGEFNGREEIVNNIIIAHHVGAEGVLPLKIADRPLNYRVLVTYSRNYGRTTNCRNEFCSPDVENPLRTPRRDQWYNQVELSTSLNERINVRSSVALDVGALSDEVGVLLGVSYRIR